MSQSFPYVKKPYKISCFEKISPNFIQITESQFEREN